jgi:colanic acid/amylovoran biosynthesis glycosyltransferase
MSLKIAYIMSRFPHLPETFILREMNALEQMGWHITLYPLIKQQQKIIHSEAQNWLDRANYSPYLSLKIIAENFRVIFTRPLKYFGLLVRIFRESISDRKFLIRSFVLFPKSIFLAKKLQQAEINHIHAHYATHPAFVAWVIHELVGISYSVTAHAHDIFVSHTMLKTKLLAATFIAAISEFNRDYLAQKIELSLKDKIHVVHCGVNPTWYRPQPQFNITRLEILNISSLQPYKGQIYLLKACLILKEQGVSFRCRIIGEGEARLALESFIRQNQLEDHVELLGAKSQTEVAHLLPKAHCYVQPSVITLTGKMEGIPVALMEALATELPVIATEISGIPELIRPGKTGFLVPPEDPDAIAEAISKVISNPEQSQLFAKQGRELVTEEFNLVRNTTLLASLFTAILGTEKFRN